MTQTIIPTIGTPPSAAISATPAEWSQGVEPDDALPAAGIYDAYVGSGITSKAAFTVTSSAAATVDFLDISDANATLAITGKTFTVDSVQSSNGGSSTAYDQGTISIGAGATMAFGSASLERRRADQLQLQRRDFRHRRQGQHRLGRNAAARRALVRIHQQWKDRRRHPDRERRHQRRDDDRRDVGEHQQYYPGRRDDRQRQHDALDGAVSIS